MTDSSSRKQLVIPTLLLSLYVAQCLWFIGTQSLTCDEPAHMVAGLEALRDNKFEFLNRSAAACARDVCRAAAAAKDANLLVRVAAGTGDVALAGNHRMDRTPGECCAGGDPRDRALADGSQMVFRGRSQFRAGPVCILAWNDRALLGHGSGRHLHLDDLPDRLTDRSLVARPIEQTNRTARCRAWSAIAREVLHASDVRAGVFAGSHPEARRMEAESPAMELAARLCRLPDRGIRRLGRIFLPRLTGALRRRTSHRQLSQSRRKYSGSITAARTSTSPFHSAPISTCSFPQPSTWKAFGWSKSTTSSAIQHSYWDASRAWDGTFTIPLQSS